MRSGFGLRQSSFAINGKRCVVIDITIGTDNAAMAVRCVLIDAQVGHDDHVIADGCPKVTQCDLHDPVRVICTRSDRVFLHRNSEQNDSPYTKISQGQNLFNKRCAGVLHDSGQGHDGFRRRNTFANKQRRHKVRDMHASLGYQFTHGMSGAKSARA
jgi:hypothetical protein